MGRDLRRSTAPSSPVPLQAYVDALRIRKWWFLGTLVVVLAATLWITQQQLPIYVSEAEVLVKGPPSPTQPLPVNLETEAKLARSETVAARAASTLAEPLTARELIDDLSVAVSPATEVLVLSYRHPDPTQAEIRVEALANAYLNFRQDQALEQWRAATAGLDARIQSLNEELELVNARATQVSSDAERSALQLKATSLISQMSALQQRAIEVAPPDEANAGELLNDPVEPSSPSSPNLTLNLTLGLLAGLLLGAGVAFLRDRRDKRIRNKRELSYFAGTRVAAVIPRDPSWRKRESTKLVTISDSTSPTAEGYRMLRAALLSPAMGQLKTIVVTSPGPGEGKSTVTANLGVVLAQAGKRVLLLSADLRKPRLERFFDLTNVRGLSDVLDEKANPWDCVLRSTIENLSVLPSGPPHPNPAELLASSSTSETLHEIREATDYVLIDTPPVLAAADSLSLAPEADGMLLVTSGDLTTRSAVHETREALEQISAPVLAWVLNNYVPWRSQEYGYTPYYYAVSMEDSIGADPEWR